MVSIFIFKQKISKVFENRYKYINELIKIMEDSTDTNTKTKLAKHLKKYGFGCDNTFSNENIEQLWSKGANNA